MVGTNYRLIVFLFGTVYGILSLISYSVLLCVGGILRRMSLSISS